MKVTDQFAFPLKLVQNRVQVRFTREKKSELSANETLLPIVKYTHYLINYAKISPFNPPPNS